MRFQQLESTERGAHQAVNRTRVSPQMSARITGMVVQTGVVSADPVMRRRLIGSVDRVAPRLLGARLISCAAPGRVVLRIVEVEAYGGTGEDPGSHAFRR